MAASPRRRRHFLSPWGPLMFFPPRSSVAAELALVGDEIAPHSILLGDVAYRRRAGASGGDLLRTGLVYASAVLAFGSVFGLSESGFATGAPSPSFPWSFFLEPRP